MENTKQYQAVRAAQNCQLLNFHARVMDLRAQATLFGGPAKWPRMQLQQPAVPVPPESVGSLYFPWPETFYM